MNKFKRLLSIVLTISLLCTTFLSTGMIAHASMLPLDEVKAYLVLYDKTPSQLKTMSVNDMLNLLQDTDGQKITIDQSATTIWRYIKDSVDGIEYYKEYSITNNDTIDLSIDAAINNYTMELIIGSGKQLNTNNKRYIVKVYTADDIEDEIEFELYTQDTDGTRNKVLPDRVMVTEAENYLGWKEINTRYRINSHVEGTEYYLGITSTVAELPYMDVKVYQWLEYFLGGSDESIEDQVLFQDMWKENKGFKSDMFDSLDGIFVFEYTDKRTNEVTTKAVEFQIYNDDSVDGYMCSYEGGAMKSTAILVGNSRDFNWDNLFPDDQTFVQSKSNKLYMLDEGLSVKDDQYFYLDITDSSLGNEPGNFNSHVIKAVVGHYATIEETEGLEDIKEYLTPTNKSVAPYGYKTNYDHSNANGGAQFTLFYDDGNKLTLTIGAIDYNPKYDPNYVREFTDKPIIGEADPWIRVTGANGIKDKDVYIVENGKSVNMDTYYGYGYQTILINDSSVNLSNLSPKFEYINSERVYAVSSDTNERVDENHTRNFNNENQQYTGVIIDKNKNENERNYWVTFKKLDTSGAKLFVNGPKEREVILDEYFEFKHDILVANIGNAPLEDLKVELHDAENVKLDPYWTLGGDGNDTLAAFTTTAINSKYGELSNLAKIRLLPDGEGEVKGTLVITAKDQTPVMITLNGRAQNPEIITEKLDDAVKYVPYQHIIATNNMHDWVETKFSIKSGTLPTGITLNTNTGELYGVPTVPAGSTEQVFTFTVEAKYLVEGRDGYFNSSTKELSIKVKPNTDENVYLASDSSEGYYIMDHIGTENGQYHYVIDVFEDTVFRSYGSYGEFKALWLNGEKLVEGVDYDSEEGSTKITVKGQTFENKTNPNETNTIAMEFRKDDDELNRTSQNFVPETYPNVDNVIAKIKALPDASSITLNNKSAVQSARAAYNALTSVEKGKVTNYSKLTACENKIAQLEADKAAADAVVIKINNIPSVINNDAKDEINIARTAYNALTSAQKSLVTNYSRLTAAESALKTYEEQQAQIAADKAAANVVVSKIDQIPSSLTLDDKDKVDSARNAYNTLTSSQKGYVTNYNKLTSAEAKIIELEAEAKSQAEINAVISAINAIPDNLTLADKSKVTSARAAYNALTNTQKSSVINYADLEAAESTIAALEAQESANKADQAAAKTVIDKINNLPDEITLENKNAVQDARTAYDDLTDKQKALVTNYSDLTMAEETIKTLEEYEAANKKDKEAADKVIEMIDALPDNITLEDKSDVEEARKAYDELTDKQKEIVTNYETLTSAEVKIAELEDDNYEEVKSVTFVGILVDKNGKAYADRFVEIHSVVQNGRTDENGSFQFNNVEFGEHTIFVKDDNGNILAQKSFNLKLGSPLSMSDTEIVAPDGAVFTVKMQMDGDQLSFLNLEEGNKAPVVDTDKDDDDDDGINIGDPDKNEGDNEDGSGVTPDQDVQSPQTGDNSNITFWVFVLVVSLAGLLVTSTMNVKSKRKARHY